MEWTWVILALAVVVIALALSGIRIVRQQERWIIELFGRYHRTLQSGLNWICPWIMRVRAKVPIWELMLPLFEQPIKIDFRDGSAVPKGAKVFVQVKNPDAPYPPVGKLGREMTGVERAIYEIQNWRIATQELMENALRSYLNGLTIDEGITMGRAGYDLKNSLPNDEVDRISAVLAGWGFEFPRITVQDFDLSEELLRARETVQIRQREAEAAQYVRQRRAQETMGALIQMMAESTGKSPQEVQTEVENDPALKARLRAYGEELIARRMSLDEKALIDIRTAGGGDLEQVLLRLIAALKRPS